MTNTSMASFIAPQLLVTTALTFSLTVTDSAGAPSMPVSVTITVGADNDPPTAEAGDTQAVNTVGTIVTLDGSGSSDSEGQPLTYQWTQVTDMPTVTVALMSANTSMATFAVTIDKAKANVDLLFRLTVNDGVNDSLPDDVTITVSNNAPRVDFSSIPTTAFAGGTIILSATVTDSDNDPLTYTWSQTDGVMGTFNDTTIANPIFTASDTTGQVRLQLVVDDLRGGMVSDDLTITVEPDLRPTANAGDDQNVQVGMTVTLDGTGSSDLGGDDLTYRWTQSGGTPTVTLINPNTADPTFTAPDTAGDVVLSLIVTNESGLSSAASEVTITVLQGLSIPDIDDRTFTAGSEPKFELPAASGGSGNYVYNVLPNIALPTGLPDGLMFGNVTREISGTAMTLGNFTVTYTASDANVPTLASAVQTFAITIEADAEPSFVDPTIAPQVFVVGTDVMTVVLPEANGGNGTLTYSLSPPLPAGLDFNEMERTITGDPSQALTPTVYTYTVTDNDMDTATREFTITVYNPVTFDDISDVSLTAGRQIAAFRLPEASGGSGNYNYEVSALPDGLSFRADKQTISGTPTTATLATVVTYTASDGVNNPDLEPAIQTFTITVAEDSADNTNDFVTTWRTANNNETIIIPTTGSGYNYTVDWGDGTPTTNHTGNAFHTYDTAGVYTVRISGVFPRISFASIGKGAGGLDNDQRDRIIAVIQWGGQQWSSMEGAFRSASLLEGLATDTPDLRNVTSMENMFNGAAAFNQDIGDWDVSNVENMAGMFNTAQAFNGDIGDWDVSNVENMARMFNIANAFNQDIGDWDVSNVTDMSSMFGTASTFNQYIGDWDVRNVTDMSFMFSAAEMFNQNIGDWDVGNVTNMSGMFNQARTFNQDIGDWDVSNVTDMSSMFSNQLSGPSVLALTRTLGTGMWAMLPI